MKHLLIILCFLLPYSAARGGENKGYRVDCENIYPELKVQMGYPQRCCTTITDSNICHYEHYDSVTDMFWVDTVLEWGLAVEYSDSANNIGSLKEVIDTIINKHPILIPCSTLACEEEKNPDADSMSWGWEDAGYPIKVNLIVDTCRTIHWDDGLLPGDPPPKCDTVKIDLWGCGMINKENSHIFQEDGWICEPYKATKYFPSMVMQDVPHLRCVRCEE